MIPVELREGREGGREGPFESFNEILHNILRKTVLTLPGYEDPQGKIKDILSVNRS